MKKKKILITALFLLTVFFVYTVVYFLSIEKGTWQRAFGSPNMHERACSVTFTGSCDGESGYLVAGYVLGGDGVQSNRGHIMKINKSGEIYWKKNLPVNKIKSVIKRSEGGYVVSGRDMNRNLFYLEINNDGSCDTGDLNLYEKGDGWCIIESHDPISKEKEGYFIAGYCDSNIKEQHLYVIQSFANGNEEKEVEFKANELSKGYVNSIGISAQQTSDGGYIITGGLGDAPYPTLHDDCDVFLFKLNHDLKRDTGWETNPKIFYRDYNIHSEGNHVEEVEDGYLITGVTNGNKDDRGFEIYSDVFLLKTDKHGNVLPGWPKIYNDDKVNGKVLGAWKEGQSVKVIVDNDENELGYLIAGYTKIETNNRENDVFALYTDVDGKCVKGFPKYFGGKSVFEDGCKVGGDEGVTG